MNIPTKLTVLRLILTPFVFIFFFLPIWGNLCPYCAKDSLVLSTASVILMLLVYLVCELTDFLDGFIARKYHMITDLGKVLDPFSDVMIHLTFFICFTFVGLMPVWAFTIIFYREISITFIRMISTTKGIVVPANWWGKGKTVLYAISALFGLIFVSIDRLAFAGFYSGIASVLPEIPSWGSKLVAWGLPSLKLLFVLAALASLVSFLSYLIPFFKLLKQQKK